MPFSYTQGLKTLLSHVSNWNLLMRTKRKEMENDALIIHLACSGLTQILNLSSLHPTYSLGD